MTYILIHHKVADYAKWKRAVRAFAPVRKASGEKSFQVLRCAKAANDLTVICGWASAAQARKFIASPELRDAMRTGGVLGRPEIRFFKQAEDLTVA